MCVRIISDPDPNGLVGFIYRFGSFKTFGSFLIRIWIGIPNTAFFWIILNREEWFSPYWWILREAKCCLDEVDEMFEGCVEMRLLAQGHHLLHTS